MRPSWPQALNEYVGIGMNLTDPVVEGEFADLHRRSICVRVDFRRPGVVHGRQRPGGRPDGQGLVPRVLARTSSYRVRRETPDPEATERTASLIWSPVVDLGQHRHDILLEIGSRWDRRHREPG